jgi:RimJ/RimL family protein N-acetyltransferase
MVHLLVISRKEAAALLECPLTIRGLQIYEDALPASNVLRRLLESNSEWTVPRLFVDDQLRVVVGSGGFKRAPANRRVEIGYGVAPRCRGKEIATEAVRLLVAEAFRSRDVEEVTAETSVTNLASRRVLEKLGFICVGQRDDIEDGRLDCWVLKKCGGGR